MLLIKARIDLTSDSNRPMPILVEEPLDDLPARLGGAILSTLLRHSIDAQVICLSDQRDLESWCRSVGDRVGWAGGTGSYAEQVAVSADEVVRIPAGVDDRVAAALMLQGMTAHYLVRDTYPLTTGSRCLIHAGAGGVGLLLTQMAKHLGAEVFTTVGTNAKAELSRAAGADHVVNYRDVDFVEAVEAVAGSRPLDVVYDGVGRSVFTDSLALIRRRGTMATFGNASGAVEPLSPLVLNANGSLFLTRPKLDDHVATRAELDARAEEIFRWVRDGVIDARIGLELPLEEAAEAHRQLEGRTTTGKVLLIP